MNNLPLILLLLGMAVLTGGRLMSGDIANAVGIVVSVGCLIAAIVLAFTGWKPRSP